MTVRIGVLCRGRMILVIGLRQVNVTPCEFENFLILGHATDAVTESDGAYSSYISLLWWAITLAPRPDAQSSYPYVSETHSATLLK
jgi:hypothetical protein